jgi:5-oxoprolinase (ATP-hydrolysing)
VHSHMTNTRLTDPEILESRYPVRLVEFAVRAGSGGGGMHTGGDGIVRELQFLQPMQVSLITSRRGPYRPYGLAGGEPGQLGANWRISADGRQRDRLAACVELQLAAGERIRIETPGGGGYGPPSAMPG